MTNQILSGKWAPGSQLPTETELAHDYGVSRTVVREAMVSLSSQGVLEIIPGKGTFIVAPKTGIISGNLYLGLKLTDYTYCDMSLARRFLEVPIAHLAAENASIENIQQLEYYTVEMKKIGFSDPKKFIDMDISFHMELASATKNNILKLLIKPIVQLLQLEPNLINNLPRISADALDYHEKILAAVKNRDGVSASENMNLHILSVERFMASCSEPELKKKKEVIKI